MKPRLVLINALEGVVPAFLNGTLSPSEYPDEYCTFFQFSSRNESYSNGIAVIRHGFNIRAYARTPERLEEITESILSTLRGLGFIADGNGYDLTSDETGRLGWTVDTYFLEVNNAE